MREDLEANGLARDMIYDRALWHPWIYVTNPA